MRRWSLVSKDPLNPSRNPSKAKKEETGQIIPTPIGNGSQRPFYQSQHSRRKQQRNQFLIRNTIRILGNHTELSIKEIAKKLDEQTRYSPTTQQMGAILRKLVASGELEKHIHIKYGEWNAVYSLSVK